MPSEPSLGEIVQRNKQYGQAAYIPLLEIDLPTGTVLRLARNPQNQEWPAGSGTTWQAFNFEFDDIDESTNAEVPQLTFKVGNATRTILRYVEELNVWRKINGNHPAKLRLIMVSTGAVDPAGPVGEWFFEDKGISAPPPMEWVFFKVGSESFLTLTVPRRVVSRDSCGWDFVQDCPHVATCARTLAACRVNGRAEWYGGFPMVEQGAIHG